MPSEFQFLRLPAVVQKVGLQRTKIYDLVREERFPAPRKIGRASVWLQPEVEAWMQGVANGQAA